MRIGPRDQARRWRLAWMGALVVLAGCMLGPEMSPPPEETTATTGLAAAPPALDAERWRLGRKSERTLSLYAGGQVLKTYPIVLGKDPVAAKLYQGDHRTPEGEYHIRDKYYHPYWSRFMLLDYPTPMNRETYAWSR